MKLNLTLQTWDLLVFVARRRTKKNISRTEYFSENELRKLELQNLKI